MKKIGITIVSALCLGVCAFAAGGEQNILDQDPAEPFRGKDWIRYLGNVLITSNAEFPKKFVIQKSLDVNDDENNLCHHEVVDFIKHESGKYNIAILDNPIIILEHPQHLVPNVLVINEDVEKNVKGDAIEFDLLWIDEKIKNSIAFNVFSSNKALAGNLPAPEVKRDIDEDIFFDECDNEFECDESSELIFNEVDAPRDVVVLESLRLKPTVGKGWALYYPNVLITNNPDLVEKKLKIEENRGFGEFSVLAYKKHEYEDVWCLILSRDVNLRFGDKAASFSHFEESGVKVDIDADWVDGVVVEYFEATMKD